MTTPEQHTPPVQPTGQPDPAGMQSAPPGGQPQGQSPQGQSAQASTGTPGRPPETAPSAATPDAHALGQGRTDAGADESLFGDLVSGLRSRWDEVQATFVDDPQQCVQKADQLVSDVVDRLTERFAHARSQLEEQWARGQDASTEDLRLALKRYREFFQRLLSVDDSHGGRHSQQPDPAATPGSGTA